MRALVTGASGFVGRPLLEKLDGAVVLSRDPARATRSIANLKVTAFPWRPENEPAPASAFQGIDAVFHLAGEPVADRRWTARQMAKIRHSRVLGTRNLVDSLRLLSSQPQVLVSASAIGYYGSRGDEELDESARPGNDFLAEVCVAWEQEALAARELGIRVVPLRFGIVLGRRGGALAKMLTPFRLGLGSPLGSGLQYMSWIHIDDLVDLMVFAAHQTSLDSPLNAVSPQPVTNREFTKTLGRVLGRPTFMPAVPAFALKTLIGGFAEVLLASQRVIPKAALAAGFTFRFSELEPALREVLKPSVT